MSAKDNYDESTKLCYLPRSSSYHTINIARVLSESLITNLWRCQSIDIGMLMHVYRNMDLDVSPTQSSRNILTLVNTAESN